MFHKLLLITLVFVSFPLSSVIAVAEKPEATPPCIQCHQNQQELLSGTAAVEYTDQDYSAIRKTGHNTADGCTLCHQGHEAVVDIGACLPCHDQEVNMEGFQALTANKLNDLKQKLLAAGKEVPDELWKPAHDIYEFIAEDGSLGIHNPGYTLTLLSHATDHISIPVALPEGFDDQCSSCKW